MSEYTDAAADALAAIAEAGFALTFTRKVIASVSNGTPTYGTDVTASGYAVQFPPAYGKNMKASFQKALEEASRAGTEAKYLLVSSLGSFVPRPDDTTSIGSVTWKVLGCDPICPDAATNIVFGVGVQQL